MVKNILIIVLPIVAFISGLVVDNAYVHKNIEKEVEQDKKYGTIVRVVDADTFIVDIEKIGEKRVRIYGVDTPEKNTEYGKVLKAWLESNLRAGTDVMLIQQKKNHTDRYDRMLAYLFVPAEPFGIDGDVINLSTHLISKGYSKYEKKYGIDPLYHDEFQTAEDKAKSKNSGLWDKGAWGGETN